MSQRYHFSVVIRNMQSGSPFTRAEREAVGTAAAAALCVGMNELAATPVVCKIQQKYFPRRGLHTKHRCSIDSAARGRKPLLEITVVITDDAGILSYNKTYLGKNGPTDVLSFPSFDAGLFFSENNSLRPAINNNLHTYGPRRYSWAGAEAEARRAAVSFGEIMISLERAKAQSREYGHGLIDELGFLTAHGILHLLGFDHEGDDSGGQAPGGGVDGVLMRKLEDAALAKAYFSVNNIPSHTMTAHGEPSLDGPTHGEPAYFDSAHGKSAHDEPTQGGFSGSQPSRAKDFRSGFVAILGAPNVGKSTLVNTLSGEALAAVSSKPQTTRRNARAIITTESYQMIIIDTPGLHIPKNKLDVQMALRARSSIEGADAVLLMIDARSVGLSAGDEGIEKMARVSKIPTVLAINKIDLIDKEKLLPMIAALSSRYNFDDIIPISANRGETVGQLTPSLVKHLPPGGLLYPEDMLTDQTERQLVADMIREKSLEHLSQEVPHGIDVEIEQFKKRDKQDLYDISATVYCERESHKKIIIGKNGETIKKIGASARAAAERFLNTKINMQIWIKVRRDWRNDANALRRMGYCQ